MAGDLHHTAQPPTLAAFRPWGSSAGAGRVRPAAAKIGKNFRRKRQEAEGTQRRKGNAETQRKRRDAEYLLPQTIHPPTTDNTELTRVTHSPLQSIVSQLT